METRFGPKAQEGDYVIVLDVVYMKRSATNYLAKVHNGKAYTGCKANNGLGKYIHKLIAEVVIPASMVPEERKRAIEEDIQASNAV